MDRLEQRTDSICGLLSVSKRHLGDFFVVFMSSHLNLIYKKYMHIKYHKMRPSVPEQTLFLSYFFFFFNWSKLKM